MAVPYANDVPYVPSAPYRQQRAEDGVLWSAMFSTIQSHPDTSWEE